MRSEHPELAGPLKRCLGALDTVSWPWIPVLGLLEPPRRDGENAQKTRKNGEEMGEIWSKRCEGVGITCRGSVEPVSWPLSAADQGLPADFAVFGLLIPSALSASRSREGRCRKSSPRHAGTKLNMPSCWARCPKPTPL